MILIFPTGNITNDLLATSLSKVTSNRLKSVALKAKLPCHIRRPFFRLVGLT